MANRSQNRLKIDSKVPSLRPLLLRYPLDPKTGKPSVTLLLVLISAILVIANVGLAASGLVKGELPLIKEFFFGALGAYTARKFTFSKDSTGIVGEQSNE